MLALKSESAHAKQTIIGEEIAKLQFERVHLTRAPEPSHYFELRSLTESASNHMPSYQQKQRILGLVL